MQICFQIRLTFISSVLKQEFIDLAKNSKSDVQRKSQLSFRFVIFFFELFQLEIFSFQLLQQKLTISIGKMFSMDYELIYSVSSPTKHKTIIKKYKPTIIFSR